MEEYIEKEKAIRVSGPEKWLEIEAERRARAAQTGLNGKERKPFWYVVTQGMLRLIGEISEEKGFLSGLDVGPASLERLTEETQKQEAYYSSRIEGAVTSLDEAMECLSRPGRRDYHDESMQMIVNNRDALAFIRSRGRAPVDHALIHRLQEILVRNTHKHKPITVGAYRRGPVYVVDGRGEVVYEAPPAGEVQAMMDSYVQWLNNPGDTHPLIKAALVHLYFVHVHPFDDGNGRSARALSNLYLRQKDYHFINFLAPSDYFDHHRGAYYRAIQNAEAHNLDATFFILYYLEALAGQLKEKKKDVQKAARLRDVSGWLGPEAMARLDKKTLKAVDWMAAHEEPLTTKKYCKLAHCSDETARRDFNRLLEAGLIRKTGQGRATGYVLAEGAGKKEGDNVWP